MDQAETQRVYVVLQVVPGERGVGEGWLVRGIYETVGDANTFAAAARDGASLHVRSWTLGNTRPDEVLIA